VEGDTYHGIEVLIGGQAGAMLDGNDDDNWFEAAGGENQFRGHGGDDILIGHDQRDHLFGDAGLDEIYGQGGDDILRGGLGEDYLFGGAGNDLIGVDINYGHDALLAAERDFMYGGDGNDIIYNNGGNDVIDGGDGTDVYEHHYLLGDVTVDLAAGTVIGEASGSDTILNIEIVYGNQGDDTLLGDDQANELHGSLGEDILRGRGGDDTLHGSYDNDEIYGDEGNDVLSGGEGSDIIDGGDGIDTLYGWFTDANLSTGQATYLDDVDTLVSIENLRGGSTDNTLIGNNQDNVLDGGGANDTLNGRRGDDTLIGGQGEDTFVFDQNGFSDDQDVVEDFELGIDRLDFSNSNIGDLDEFFERATQVGADVVIDTGDGAITLINVQLSAMSFGDLIF
jgi:Ca2+-binding RTX toxin-like protein